VETVKPYFADFLRRWPTLEDLAAADIEDVLHAWSGLGYYARARNLHKCAIEASKTGLPDSYAGLLRMPGVGPYTAGAIASIAHGEAVPAVDGNVERVLSRLDGRDADPKSTSGRRELRERANQLLTGPPGDINQALMELGALVCTPRSPSCGSCPWAEPCVARATNRQTELPKKAAKRPPKPVTGVTGILRQKGRVLLGRRPPSGLLGGLWEPVRIDIGDGRDPAVEIIAAFRDAVGIDIHVVKLLGEVVHTFTHRRLTLSVFEVATQDVLPERPTSTYEELRWLADPGTVALSTLARKVLAIG
jgi:A/G-specific adenine glycosylase